MKLTLTVFSLKYFVLYIRHNVPKIRKKGCQFSILDGDVPRSTSYGVYISQLIRFARASSYIADLTLAINC